MSYNIIKIYLLAEADTQDLFDAVVAIESIENSAIERIEIDFERTLYIKNPANAKRHGLDKTTVPFTEDDHVTTSAKAQDQIETSTTQSSDSTTSPAAAAPAPTNEAI